MYIVITSVCDMMKLWVILAPLVNRNRKRVITTYLAGSTTYQLRKQVNISSMIVLIRIVMEFKRMFASATKELSRTIYF